MPMTSGTRLGPYEILAPIGAGGMGEVYKARDTRLDRAVAIKVLPDGFAHDEQLKVRFQREAKTISQLSHPNICALFDVGENYLVMELLEGETLADRLSKGPLPFSDVLKFGIQIADALGRAHRAGIVHRDLKPGNIMLTKSGSKLLDFGLARSGVAAGFSQPDDDGGLKPAATLKKPLTAEGTIVGTFQYMSPEQLEGLEADARTDIFALGCVLYEMATGKRAFDGKTKTSVIAAIVSGEPKPLREVQPVTPPAFEHVVKKCLEKDPDTRWQSAQDVAEELRWISEEQPAAAARPSAWWPLIFVTALLALVIGGLIGAWSLQRRRVPEPVTYTEITPPEGNTFVFEVATAAVSPDGRSIAFVARSQDGPPMIWVRPLDSSAARALKGTENAEFPFWSPDSRYLGFFAGAKLKRIDVVAGPPETLADAPRARGGAWAGNIIIFTPTPASPLNVVSASGGPALELTALNIPRGDVSHRFPVFLPDGRHFLAYIQGATEGGNILIGSIDSKDTHVIMTADAGVEFAPPDYVFFVRDLTLRVQRIDLTTFRLVGDSVPIAEHVQTSSGLNFANTSVSSNGVLTYVSGGLVTAGTLTFLDRHGKELGTVGGLAEQLDPRLAPDGHAILVSRAESNGLYDIWMYDLRRNVSSRLTFSPYNEFAPVWSPDSKAMAFTSFEKRPGDIFIKRVDASGPGEVLYADRRRKIPSDWSADGNYIVYHALSPGTQWDIEAYSMRDHKVIPLVRTPAAENTGQLSPDERWLSYCSSESGRSEVYVQPFPVGTQRWQISGGGGVMSRWSRDGRELYYCSLDGKLMAATVHATGTTFAADAPHALFPTRLNVLGNQTRSQYDVSADGRFLMNVNSTAERQVPINLVQNWTARLPQ